MAIYVVEIPDNKTLVACERCGLVRLISRFNVSETADVDGYGSKIYTNQYDCLCKERMCYKLVIQEFL